MTERAQAILELLAQPCPQDIYATYRLTQAGDPDRFDLLKSQPNVYAQYLRQAHDDISEAKVTP